MTRARDAMKKQVREEVSKPMEHVAVREPIKETKAPKRPAKTLDDLFRSTKTEPRIYWLPAVNNDAERDEK